MGYFWGKYRNIIQKVYISTDYLQKLRIWGDTDECLVPKHQFVCKQVYGL